MAETLLDQGLSSLENTGDIGTGTEWSVKDYEGGTYTGKSVASGAEAHRVEHRAATDAIQRAEAELAQTTDPARRAELDKALENLKQQYETYQALENNARGSLTNLEGHKTHKEQELVEATENVTAQYGTLGELQRNLAEVSASISRAEQRVKDKRSEFLHKLSIKDALKVFTRRTSGEALAQERVYADRLKEIKAAGGLDDAAAEAELKKQLSLETKEVEAALKQQIDTQKEKITQAERKVQTAAAEHTVALRSVKNQESQLEKMKQEMQEVGKKGQKGAEAIQSLEAEIQNAQKDLEEKQAVLKKAEEAEKAYWETLKNEFLTMAPTMGEFAGLSDEEFSALKKEESKRESVRSMLGMKDVDILVMANEIGRNADGERSVDIAVSDMVDVTGKMVERYRALAEAAGKYDEDFSALEMRTMADVDNEAFDLVRKQQQIEYAKFEVLDDAQLDEALRALDQKLDQNQEVQKLKQDIATATAYLEKPSHKTAGFKRLHQQQIREYEGIKRAGERDLKKASRDIENQKNALTKYNELQRTKAKAELANWKKEYLNKFISRRRSESTQALDTFLGSLESFTPEERELAYKGEYQKALAEAEAIFDNLKKWDNLLRLPDVVVQEIAKVLVEQDHLDEEAIRKYETTQSAVKLKELEMKGKRGAVREELEGELKALRREAKVAETALSQRSNKKQEAIEAVRTQHLPVELAATDPATAGEIQFGTRKEMTDVRKVYDRVMFGGTVREAVGTEVGTITNPTELTGVVEVYGDAGELDAAIEEEIARQKTEGVGSVEAGAERSFDAMLGEILASGPEAVKKLVERADVEEVRGMSAEMAQRFIDLVNMKTVFDALNAAIIDHLTDQGNASKGEKARRWAVLSNAILEGTNTRDRFTDIQQVLEKIPNLIS